MKECCYLWEAEERERAEKVRKEGLLLQGAFTTFVYLGQLSACHHGIIYLW